MSISFNTTAQFYQMYEPVLRGSEGLLSKEFLQSELESGQKKMCNGHEIMRR